MERLVKKFETAKKIAPQPIERPASKPTSYGVIYFGSTSPAMGEALDLLEADGVQLDAMRVRSFPFAASVDSFIARHDKVFIVEQNRDGQVRGMIMNECSIDPAKLLAVCHYDGTPITARFIVKAIGDKMSGANVRPIRKAGTGGTAA